MGIAIFLRIFVAAHIQKGIKIVSVQHRGNVKMLKCFKKK